MSHAPALVRAGSKKKEHHMKWDEDNLKLNEEIKAALPQCKIDEPKTPYHAPQEGDTVDLEPLDLDGTGHQHLDMDRPSAAEKHAQFEAARKAHYAKEALAAARKAAQEALEEAEAEEQAQQGNT